LKVGNLVLAKSFEGGLWARAIILDITHGTLNNEGSCVVKYETKGLGEIEVPMQNIFPLNGKGIILHKYIYVEYNYTLQ
jgi:hypothetical protein